MPVTIEFGDKKYTVENMVWEGEDAFFVEVFNKSFGEYINTSPSNPFPDLEYAQEIVDRLGAEIIEIIEPEFEEGTVY